MPASLASKVWLPALLAAGALLSTGQPPGAGGGTEVTGATGFVGDPETLLPGTWLRETQADGASARHLLALDPDHHFREVVRVVDVDGHAVEYAHAGTWLYDGTNLKRKYTSM